MPCDYVLSAEQTAEQRRREVDQALEGLERALASGSVEIRVSPDGEICFADWGEERRGVTDCCAYLALEQRDSWEFRQAVARAEAIYGAVSKETVLAGRHSHDGGRSWS